jgi:RHS repeat-associated protein
VAPRPDFSFAISNTPTGLGDPLYDFRGGPLSSGYFRDQETGLDYAKNRYHQPGMGRFLTPDPYINSAGSDEPGSWNRYAYTRGDPVNRIDRKGLDDEDPDDGDDCDDDRECNADGVDGGGGAPVFYDNAYAWSVDYIEVTSTSYFGQNGNNSGGGAGGPSAGTAHSPGSSTGPMGYKAALKLLKNASTQCLKDINASSSSQAVSALQNSTIDYSNGPAPTFNASGQVANGATPAQQSGNTITINLNFGWINPSSLLAQSVGGGVNVYNWLGDWKLCRGRQPNIIAVSRTSAPPRTRAFAWCSVGRSIEL